MQQECSHLHCLTWFNFSTGDSTVFVFRGKSKKESNWILLQDGDDPKTTNQFVYGNEEDGTDNLNVLRVRLTFTMNAAGMCAAIFITVTGLTERELQKEECPSGVLHVSIKGIRVGGTQDLRHDAVGYLAFYRKKKCVAAQTMAEQRNFTFYCHEVLISFIDISRQKLYGYVEGGYTPDYLAIAS